MRVSTLDLYKCTFEVAVQLALRQAPLSGCWTFSGIQAGHSVGFKQVNTCQVQMSVNLHFGSSKGPFQWLQDTLVIGSRFDGDASGASCRQAFYGRLVHLLDVDDPQQLRRLRIFKLKQRRGVVDRISPDQHSAVCRGMFKKDTDISLFSNLKAS